MNSSLINHDEILKNELLKKYNEDFKKTSGTVEDVR